MLNFFSYLNFTNEKFQIKIFKNLILIFLNFETDYLFGTLKYESKVSKDDLLRILKNIVQDAYSFSKLQNYDIYFKEEEVSNCILDLLKQCRCRSLEEC